MLIRNNKWGISLVGKLKNGLIKYLNKYYDIQKDIKLVYRPDIHSSWKRVDFLSQEYNPHTLYNHRSVLNNEVVIEYDEDDPSLNKILIDMVSRRLVEDGIHWAKWHSGNKSTHLHFLINPEKASRLNLLKSAFLQVYGIINFKGVRYSPDFQLTSSNCLVRAENGIHEKTGQKKKLISTYGKYPSISEVPDKVWYKYTKLVKKVIRQKISTVDVDILKSDKFKYFLKTENMRLTDDGRERVMFMLIHLLKPQYEDKRELAKFIEDWYKYSGGYKLSPRQIAGKVYYHWNRRYTIGWQYLDRLYTELDIEDSTKDLNSKD